MDELMRNKEWMSLNDPINGNGVFNCALPQVTHAQMGEDTLQIKYQDFSSIPLNGKSMFTTKLQAPDSGKRDPGDYYKKGGMFEIPVYLEQPTVEYEVYPVTPPALKILDHAIQTKIFKDPTRSQELNDLIFVYCSYYCSKMPGSSNLKFCVVCGKDIEKYFNF